jgi:hypothetical protein
MAQGLIVANMSGQAALDVINNNFTELYNSIPVVLRLKNVLANTQQAIAANTKIVTIDIAGIAGAPTMRIGLTPNGTEIMDDTPIGNLVPVVPDYYAADASILYFTIAGGTVNIRIGLILNFF